jgi:Histidine kinase-, DNA gyrase B-, and HSP90-like ATPase
MTTTINVNPKQDFWHRLCRTGPLRAVSELVWNSFDADAENVSVEFRLNPLEGVEEIIVKDDGSGIPFENYSEHKFGSLGGSWKATSWRTQKRRLIHGRNGEGRFRAFALGNHVTWSTIYRDGKDYDTYDITGTSLSPGKFVLNELKKCTASSTGTTVFVRNLTERQDGILLAPEFSDNMARVFAPYLLNYRNIKLVINGKLIDTREIVFKRREYEIGPIRLSEGQKITAQLEIVEWRSISGRALYLCDQNGFALSERNPEIRAPGFNFGAYLKSQYFADLDQDMLLDIDLAEGMGHLLYAARGRLAEYFKQREREKTRALIASWKAEGVYPYSESATSPTEAKARQVFDICAVTVHDYVDGFENQSKSAKSLSFRLLKEAIQSNSPELSKIFSEVLLLPRAKQRDLSGLLEKANLVDIIDTVKEIEHRLSVATGLRKLVCSVDIRDSVKEREHIHRIVELNPWIFGEQYALGRSEVGLTNMLREHLKLLKRDTRTLEPVLQSGCRRGRVDIMLAKLVKISGRSDDNHLILELKRANKKLSHKDFAQIFDYANAVITDPRFDKTQVSWDFWLIGVETDQTMDQLCNAADRPPGCAHIFRSHRAKIWVKTWGEILYDCLGRHEYLRNKLDIEVVEDEASAYVDEMYIKVVHAEDEAGSRDFH